MQVISIFLMRPIVIYKYVHVFKYKPIKSGRCIPLFRSSKKLKVHYLPYVSKNEELKPTENCSA